MNETASISRGIVNRRFKSIRCLTCFSQNRKLKCLRDARISAILSCLFPEIEAMKADDHMICWECDAIVRNVIKFREKVLNAQALWKKAQEGEQIDAKGISSLESTTALFVSFTLENSELQESASDLVWKTELSLHEPLSKLEVKAPEEIKTEPECIEQDSNSGEIDFDIPNIIVSDIKIDIDDAVVDSKKPTKKTTKKKASTKKPNAKKHLKTEKLKHEAKSKSKPTKNPDEKLDDIVIRKECLKESCVDNETVLTFEERAICTMRRLTEEEMLAYREGRKDEKIYKSSELKCEWCIRRFYTRQAYVDHQSRHDELFGSLVCAVCTQRFTEQRALDDHHASHYKMYKCRQCEYERMPLELVLRHYQRNHLAARRVCKDCRAEFRSSNEYNRHRTEMHAPRAECTVCNKMFDDRNTLAMHHIRWHNGEVLECSVCAKKIKGPNRLRLHMKRMHENVEENLVYCVQCNTQYKNKQSLRSHYRTSSKHNLRENMKYVCGECGKRFYQSGALRRHREGAHLRAGGYACAHCGECFNTKNRMFRHITIKHKGGEPRDKMCHYCGKAFTSRTFLREHINTHTGERPYVCEDCGATFSASGALFWHRKCVHKIPTLKQKRLAEELEREEARLRET